MDINISPLFHDVNKSAVLFLSAGGNRLAYMKYGERLRLARKTAKGEKISQAQLAEMARVEQSLISQLENSQTAEGSQYTNRLARALGISPDWLADEEGEMIPTTYTTSDPTLVEMLKVLEPRGIYEKTAAFKAVMTTVELVDHAAQGVEQAKSPAHTKTYRPPDRRLGLHFYGGTERRAEKKNADEE